jgi:hypothetical protein
MESKDLIKWSVLSRMLSGSRQTVRRNNIPQIHQRFVSDLLNSMDRVVSKRTVNKDVV